jgi:hypothetical protein
VRFIHWAFAAGLLCLTLSSSIQADEFQKKIIDMSNPATYRVALGKEKIIQSGNERERNNLTFELLELSVLLDSKDW